MSLRQKSQELKKLLADNQRLTTEKQAMQVRLQKLNSEKKAMQVCLLYLDKPNGKYPQEQLKQIGENQKNIIMNLQKKLKQEENLQIRSQVMKIFIKFCCDSEILTDSQRKQLFRHFGQKTTSKLLYKYDAMNKTNFHNYFDNKQRILFIAKGKQNQRVFGGFCGVSFTQNIKFYDKTSFLFCFDAQDHLQVYDLDKYDRPIQYDQIFMMFGNSDLRIKKEELKVYSSMGTVSCFYGKKRNGTSAELFGIQTNELPINNYEIYQLFDQ